jgi:hypothetical protein
MALGLGLSLCLSSCGSDNEDKLSAKVVSLTQEKDALSTKVDSLTLEKAEIQKKSDDFMALISSMRHRDEVLEKEAGAALACDWLIALCPQSLVDYGRRAIKAGYTPDPFWFWIYAFLKFAVLGLYISWLFFTFKFFHILVIMPVNQDLIDARETIKNADYFMRHEKDQLQAEIDELNLMTRENWNVLNKLDEDIQSKQETQFRVKKEIAQLNVMKDLLTNNLIT